MDIPEIKLSRLRELIADEYSKTVSEAVDHKNINSVVTVASKLLAAVEAFKEKAPPAAINAVTPHLAEMEKVLENMVSAPGSYVPVLKKEPKKVSLKAVKESSIPKIPDLRGEYIKAMANKKGLKLRLTSGGYDVVQPSGEAITFKTRDDLIKYLNGY